MASFEHKMINYKRGVLVLPRVDDLEFLSLAEPDPRAESSTQQYPLGSALITDDGVFRYAKCGAAAVTIGKLLQQAVVGNAAWIRNVAVAAIAAIGATSVTITTPAGGLTVNKLKDGYLFVDTANGAGAVYKIKSHPAADAGASCVITLVDPLEVALTTDSKVGLRANLYDGVIVNPTTPTGVPVGVVNHSSFTAAYYAWIKTKGIVALLTNGTVIVGKLVTAGATTAGSVDVHPLNSVAASGQEAVIGKVLNVGSTTEYSLVEIDLDPSW